MPKKFWLIVLVGMLLGSFTPVLAQEQGLRLSISRLFGYSSLGTGEIQGLFSLEASGPADLQQVTFYLDEQVLGQVAQAPFKVRFDTDRFALGRHTLKATAIGAGDRELHSNEIDVAFVTPQAGWQAGMKFLLIFLPVILGASVLSILVPAFLNRGKSASLEPGARRNYGFQGGAICPHCARPYATHLLAFNLGFRHRLDRCPFCGRWAVVSIRSEPELRAAEQAELERARAAVQAPLENEEERLRQELERSRYREL